MGREDDDGAVRGTEGGLLVNLLLFGLVLWVCLACNIWIAV